MSTQPYMGDYKVGEGPYCSKRDARIIASNLDEGRDERSRLQEQIKDLHNLNKEEHDEKVRLQEKVKNIHNLNKKGHDKKDQLFEKYNSLKEYTNRHASELNNFINNN